MLKRILSILLIVTILFSFCNITTANNNKFTKEEYKEIIRVLSHLKKTKWENRWLRTKLTKEWLKNLAASIRWLSYNTYYKWILEKWFWKETANTFLEYLRSIAYNIEKSTKLIKVAEHKVENELINIIMYTSGWALWYWESKTIAELIIFLFL